MRTSYTYGRTNRIFQNEIFSLFELKIKYGKLVDVHFVNFLENFLEKLVIFILHEKLKRQKIIKIKL